MESIDLVSIKEYGLRGSNFYWTKAKAYDLSKDELMKVGVVNSNVLIHKNLVEPLNKVNQEFKNKLEYSLFIKEGYRSPDLYRLIYDKRVKKFGQDITDKLLNIKDMPHSTGLAVDVALWDDQLDREVFMRDGKDDPDALIYGFYKGKLDEKSLYFQKLQTDVITIMKDNGFSLGKLNEYFHFNYF